MPSLSRSTQPPPSGVAGSAPAGTMTGSSYAGLVPPAVSVTVQVAAEPSGATGQAVAAGPVGVPNVVPAGGTTRNAVAGASDGPALRTVTLRPVVRPGSTVLSAGPATSAVSRNSGVPAVARAPVTSTCSPPSATVMPVAVQAAGGVTAGATATVMPRVRALPAGIATPVHVIAAGPFVQIAPSGAATPVTVNPSGRAPVGTVRVRPSSSWVEATRTVASPLRPGTTVAPSVVTVSRLASGVRRLIVARATSSGLSSQSVSSLRLTQPPVSGTAGSAAAETSSGRVSVTGGPATGMSLVQRSVAGPSWVQPSGTVPMVVPSGATTTNEAPRASDGPWLRTVTVMVAVWPGRTVRAAGPAEVTPSVQRGSAVTNVPVAVPVESSLVAVAVAVHAAVTPGARVTGTLTVTVPIAGTTTPVHRIPLVVVQAPPPVVVTVPTV